MALGFATADETHPATMARRLLVVVALLLPLCRCTLLRRVGLDGEAQPVEDAVAALASIEAPFVRSFVARMGEPV